MKLETLYKKTSTGAIQQWTISFEENADGHGVLITEHGQIGGKIQIDTDVIKEGKSKGKKNETTPFGQAMKEAQAKWEKQKKKGYVLSLEAAQAGEVDADAIQGGINPMLAHKYVDHGKKIKFPCYVQPKLDGQRAPAIIDSKHNDVTLWTRTRKRITSVPHITKALAELFPDAMTMTDGELYNHEYCDDFESLISETRKDEASEDAEIIQYHIYDLPDAHGDMRERVATMNALAEKFKDHPFIKFVPTYVCEKAEDVDMWHDKFFEMGYEGLMLRNMDSLYENKRSYNLQKYKKFDEEEFEIIGIETGRGKLQNCVAKFVCRLPNGGEVKAKLKGRHPDRTGAVKKNLDFLRACYKDHSLWKGKKLTIRFQGWTNANDSLRFPVGKAIRDYE